MPYGECLNGIHTVDLAHLALIHKEMTVLVGAISESRPLPTKIEWTVQ